jgi:hypothetical protein
MHPTVFSDALFVRMTFLLTVARLRVCQHSFHRACIQTWFRASVRCPVCRRDIREDPAAQTSSASTGISSQAQTQWGGEDTDGIEYDEPY